MQIVVKIVAVIAVVFLSLVAFMPFKEGYFALEDKLAQHRIYLNETYIDERFGGLGAEETALIVDGLTVANVKRWDAQTALLWTRLRMEGIAISKSLASMVPVDHIDTLTVTHTLMRPKQFRIVARTDKGNFEANSTIGERRLRFYAQGDRNDSSLPAGFQHDKQGWYYEIAF